MKTPPECPLDSIAAAIAFTPHDWSTHHRMAWIYGIACGWDEESLAELSEQHGWTPETVERLKRLRSKWESLNNVRHGAKLLVSAVIDNGFVSKPTEVHLEKDGVKLNAADWMELHATLVGERTVLHSELEEGQYIPKQSFVFNHSSTDPETTETPDSTEFFHSGNEKEDVTCLLDMAIDLVERWDVKDSPYNQSLKRCWMKRAQELGANLSW